MNEVIVNQKILERINKLFGDSYKRMINVCDTTSLSMENLQNLMSGKIKTISFKTIAELADYYEISIDYLLGRTDESTIYNPLEDPTNPEIAQEMLEVLKRVPNMTVMRAILIIEDTRCLLKNTTYINNQLSLKS